MPGHPGPGRSEQPFLIAVMIVIGTESPADQNGGSACLCEAVTSCDSAVGPLVADARRYSPLVNGHCG
jgi:hypothetical protein